MTVNDLDAPASVLTYKSSECNHPKKVLSSLQNTHEQPQNDHGSGEFSGSVKLGAAGSGGGDAGEEERVFAKVFDTKAKPK